MTGEVLWRSKDERIKLLRDGANRYWLAMDELRELTVDELRDFEYALMTELTKKAP